MTKFRTTLKLIRRSPYQSIAAVIMTTVTFFIISVSSLAALGGHQLLQFFQSRPQVTAFFKDGTTPAQVEALKTQITQGKAIESATYISQSDALTLYREQNQDNPLLLEMVTADILPASLEVSAKNVTDLASIAETMQQSSYVEEVVFQKDVIDTLAKWVNGLRWGGAILSGLLVFASVTTIIIILGLKFSNKKNELKTLALLGASSWYIRSPFLVEGILYSLLGAFLGWGISYLVLLYTTPNLIDFLTGIPLLPVPLWVMAIILGGELLLGAILGAVSSLIATRRLSR
ncbi:MAG: Cell division protein [Microgenomates group bacterium GW2011_GWC1_46_16]|uniref:Cell division protein FtsX n=2 Tax=Candidatus Collieribacteriota TaxID=1752725 RepID=A0A1F5FXZ3_9BACT|nr:MAG: Cell division protein [Microgenomates group bacterium GW2011_GWF1_46_12]KKU26280.1 MAG: Cell division protein [Microgenomates group bacterium GW2011_GWC1_46_16]KKU27647.1 MAG: Cell division protein [Microgenomates group bacterium GW2011_GWF2_46_18]KKU42071.1 MAG: Cell division protein [Microgenomates group bacterium GW2011_GWA1_46_7]KKU45368.1 MAG: Cell division protein [Microgenomates group bacterium GW2011_GWB1_46_7]KKU61057.1 MAG: Cell division protein [Microgenomates group bacteriu